MMRKSTINNTTKFLFILMGVWPGTMYLMMYRAYWIISMSTDQICQCRYFLAHMSAGDLAVLVDCFSSFMANLKFITKLIVFWFNQRKFIKILTIMTEDWEECDSNDVNMRETMSKAKLSDRITSFMFILHVATVAAYGTNVYFADFESSDKSEPPLLFKWRLPVDMNSKFNYKLLLGAQFMHLLVAGSGTGLVNSLLLTLILHVGGQIDIVRIWLSTLASKRNEEGRVEPITNTAHKIIQKHQKIINLSEFIEELYTYIALVQFVSNMMLICTLGFLVIIALDSGNALEQISRFLLFYTITNLEAFIFCYAGEYLQNKSRAIGNAVYNCAWYELRPDETRNLVFIMLRAQKKLTLTVGKTMDLSLESFTNIMKASGSYMSMLLAMR